MKKASEVLSLSIDSDGNFLISFDDPSNQEQKLHFSNIGNEQYKLEWYKPLRSIGEPGYVPNQDSNPWTTIISSEPTPIVKIALSYLVVDLLNVLQAKCQDDEYLNSIDVPLTWPEQEDGFGSYIQIEHEPFQNGTFKIEGDGIQETSIECFWNLFSQYRDLVEAKKGSDGDE